MRERFNTSISLLKEDEVRLRNLLTNLQEYADDYPSLCSRRLGTRISMMSFLRAIVLEGIENWEDILYLREK